MDALMRSFENENGQFGMFCVKLSVSFIRYPVIL